MSLCIAGIYITQFPAVNRWCHLPRIKLLLKPKYPTFHFLLRLIVNIYCYSNFNQFIFENVVKMFFLYIVVLFIYYLLLLVIYVLTFNQKISNNCLFSNSFVLQLLLWIFLILFHLYILSYHPTLLIRVI